MERINVTQETGKNDPSPFLSLTSIYSTDLPSGTRVWIYARQASAGNNQTIESRIAAMVKVIQEKGWILDRTFKDIGTSGTSTTRESLNHMLYLAKQKPRPADAIFVRDVSQLSRDYLHLQFCVTQLHANGWKILSLNEEFPIGSLGSFAQEIIAWANEQIRKDLRKQTVRGLQYLAAQGCLPGAPVAKGYTYSHKQIGYHSDGTPRIGRKPEIDPVTAPMVVMAFERKAEGATNRAIATETGLYSPNASSWTCLFRNRIYIGEYEFHNEIYKDVYPALISLELFEAVQKRF